MKQLIAEIKQIRESLEAKIERLETYVKDKDQVIFSQQNRIAELTDTLAAVMAPEWRDIGTLPKIDPDTCRSNDLLGVWPNGTMMVVYLDVCNGWLDAEGGEPCVTMPTHWQPLPDPPSIESV